jgi:hypothetical protein
MKQFEAALLESVRDMKAGRAAHVTHLGEGRNYPQDEPVDLPAILPIRMGMFAHASRWVMMSEGASLETGALVACLIVGTVATRSNRFLTSSSTCMVCLGRRINPGAVSRASSILSATNSIMERYQIERTL